MALVLPPLAALVGGELAARRRRWARCGAGALLALALLASPIPISAALPDRCSDEPQWNTAEEFERVRDYYSRRPDCGHY